MAKRQLRDRFYGATILVARPVGNDQHIGFIVNRPSKITLSQLFPEHAPSKKVLDPVYVGGPVNSESIFALAGLVVWRSGELRDEIKRGAWHLLDADASLVVRKQTEGMWEELVRRAEIRANGI